MLTASELAQMQADAVSALDQTCTIQRATRTPRSSGGASQVWNVIASGVACAMAQPSGSQLQNYDYLVGSLSTWQIRLPVGTNIIEKDQIVVAGQTLNAIKVLQPRSYQVLLTVLATEVK